MKINSHYDLFKDYSKYLLVAGFIGVNCLVSGCDIGGTVKLEEVEVPGQEKIEITQEWKRHYIGSTRSVFTGPAEVNIRIGDMDDDSDLDVVGSDKEGRIYWYENPLY
ncbi:MAG: hypothetical protein ACE5ES_05840 [Candidatus Nanoarchaeia archaeon]